MERERDARCSVKNNHTVLERDVRRSATNNRIERARDRRRSAMMSRQARWKRGRQWNACFVSQRPHCDKRAIGGLLMCFHIS